MVLGGLHSVEAVVDPVEITALDLTEEEELMAEAVLVLTTEVQAAQAQAVQ
jgi:anti-sigma factor ChrR (cupin superfamily)